MNYPIPTHQDMRDSRQYTTSAVNEDTIAEAISKVVIAARSQGRSLEEVIAEVLADDSLLDSQQRQYLSEIVAVAWAQLA